MTIAEIEVEGTNVFEQQPITIIGSAAAP